MKKPLKYIFVAGGVMSGVGKGVASSSIGKILQARGLKVTAVKIDPYVNIDAGTMNPTEHGEVFVLKDGMECDQDMGNYERFLDCELTRANYMTTGSVYESVIARERNLEYGGRCVEVVPHIPLEVISKIDRAGKLAKADVVIVEIGGTVGEYQNVLFLEAVRMLKQKKPNDVILVLVSFLPLLGKDNELKTKPTQYAVRTLNSAGVQPDIILARAHVALDGKRKEKIAFNCGLRKEDVISAPDIESIYEIPVNFEKDKLSDIILLKLGIKSKKREMKEWEALVETIRSAKRHIKIGVVGKYFGTGSFVLADSYISVIEAIKHAVYSFKAKPAIEWLEAESFDPKNFTASSALQKLKDYHGIIVPGGFGARGVEGKINAIRFCRENKIPYFGLCYGMQLATIEFARSVAGLDKANTAEVDAKTPHPVIDLMPEQKEKLSAKNYGATMRLGAYNALIAPGTIAHKAYASESLKKSQSDKPLKTLKIFERHRHRYEVNPEYIKKLEKAGLVFSGRSGDGRLMEIMELPQSLHPFFLGTQFHPEFQSRPLAPHPLFVSFIEAAIQKYNLGRALVEKLKLD